MYLWVDLGNKKCGLAITIENIVIPKDIVPRTKIMSEIHSYIKKYNIQTIVVWLPYDLYGKQLRQLEKTEKFIEKLKTIFPDKKIVWVDERFTSKEADMLCGGPQWNKDDISAGLILESYLAMEGKK